MHSAIQTRAAASTAVATSEATRTHDSGDRDSDQQPGAGVGVSEDEKHHAVSPNAAQLVLGGQSVKQVIKALTLYQPYASLIIAGQKRFETRTWGSNYTGLLVIHAGKTLEVDSGNRTFMYHLLASGIGDPRKLPLSAALGVVWKGQCFRGRSVIPHIDERENVFGGFEGDDRVAWELENPVAFEQPIPMKGSRGLWDYPHSLPDEVLEMFAHVL